MTIDECFNKAKLIITIAKAFNEGRFKKHFGYDEENNEHHLELDTQTVIVYNEDITDRSGYDTEANYVCNNPNNIIVKTSKANIKPLKASNNEFSPDFSTEELPLEWDEETVFQYSTIYSERVLDAMMIMWYIRKNYNELFYIDLDYMNKYQKLL